MTGQFCGFPVLQFLIFRADHPLPGTIKEDNKEDIQDKSGEKRSYDIGEYPPEPNPERILEFVEIHVLRIVFIM